MNDFKGVSFSHLAKTIRERKTHAGPSMDLRLLIAEVNTPRVV